MGHRCAVSAERESPYEEQYHNKLRRVIGKDYTYKDITTAAPASPYVSADTTQGSGRLCAVQHLCFNGRSYHYIGQFVSRYLLDFGADESGTPCMTYYGFGHGGHEPVQCCGLRTGAGQGYREILSHYFTRV